jgi:hypothetical protein
LSACFRQNWREHPDSPGTLIDPNTSQVMNRRVLLCEIRVSILLLSIGALGYEALKIKGLSASSSSMWRSIPGLSFRTFRRALPCAPGSTRRCCSCGSNRPCCCYDEKRWRGA